MDKTVIAVDELLTVGERRILYAFLCIGKDGTSEVTQEDTDTLMLWAARVRHNAEALQMILDGDAYPDVQAGEIKVVLMADDDDVLDTADTGQKFAA